MNRRIPTRLAVAASAVGVTTALAAPAALAQTPKTVALQPKGATALTLDKKTAKALASLHIAVTPLKGSTVRKGAVRFPITGGSIDPKVVAPAAIRHKGGLQLKAGKTKVQLRNFTIRVNSAGAILSGSAGKTRLTIATLDLKKAKITRPNTGGPAQIGTRVSKVGVLLSGPAAKALNQAFKVKAFKKGLRLGTATVDARPKELILAGGATELTPNTDTVNLLGGAGIAPGLVPPATATPEGAFSFPIVANAKIPVRLTSGTIGHTGGISLTRGATSLALTDFDIKLDTATLAASANGSAKADIVALNLDALKLTRKRLNLELSGVVANLNATASGALTTTFGTPDTAGATLGTVVVKASVY